MESQNKNIGIGENKREISHIRDVRKLDAGELDSLLDANSPIYILNTSRPMKLMVANLPSKRGGSTQFNIPRTWIPIQVTAQFSSQSVRESDDIRAMLTKGVITLVDAADAREYMKLEASTKEYARLYQSVHARGNENASETQKRKEIEQALQANHVKQLQETRNSKIDAAYNLNSGVSTAVVALCRNLNAGSITAEEGLTEVQIIEQEITKEDCAYIIANIVQTSIVNYVRERVYPAKLND